MSFTQPITIAGISATTQLVYTTGTVATQYTNAIEDLNQNLMVVFSTTPPPQSALDAISADATTLRNLFTTGVADPTTGALTYMTTEMAKNVQPLFNLLQSIGVDVSAPGGVTISATNIANWVAQIQQGYDNPSALFDTTALNQALADAQNVNIQSLIELQYVENGNSQLGAQLDSLQTALGITQSALNQLAELQRLHNQLAINSPQPFSAFFSLESTAAQGYAAAYQAAASAYFSQVNPTLAPALYSSGYEDAQVPAGAYAINPNFQKSVVDFVSSALGINSSFGVTAYTTNSSGGFYTGTSNDDLLTDFFKISDPTNTPTNVYLFPSGTVLSSAFITYMSAQGTHISAMTFTNQLPGVPSMVRYAFIGAIPSANTYSNILGTQSQNQAYAYLNALNTSVNEVTNAVTNTLNTYNANNLSGINTSTNPSVINALNQLAATASTLSAAQSKLQTDYLSTTPAAALADLQTMQTQYNLLQNTNYTQLLAEANALPLNAVLITNAISQITTALNPANYATVSTGLSNALINKAPNIVSNLTANFSAISSAVTAINIFFSVNGRNHSDAYSQTSYEEVAPILSAVGDIETQLGNLTQNATNPSAFASAAQALIQDYSVIDGFNYSGLIAQATSDNLGLGWSYGDVIPSMQSLVNALNANKPSLAKDIQQFQSTFSADSNVYAAYQTANTINAVVANIAKLKNPPLGFSVEISQDYSAVLASNPSALKVLQAIGLQNFTVLAAGQDVGLRFNSTTNSFQESYSMQNMTDAFQDLMKVKSAIQSAIGYLSTTTTRLPNGTFDPTSLAGCLQVVLNDINKTVTTANGSPASALTPMSVAFAGFRNWLLDSYNSTSTTQQGVIQQDITYAITAAQSVNSTQQENVRNYLYVFEEYYKSASDILTAISQIIAKMADGISQ